MLGTPNIDATHTTLKPVSYLHCNIKARSTNNMKTRTTAVITLRRSNERGGNYLMSLKTGRRLNSYQWQDLSITKKVIDFLEEMVTAEESP